MNMKPTAAETIAFLKRVGSGYPEVRALGRRRDRRGKADMISTGYPHGGGPGPDWVETYQGDPEGWWYLPNGRMYKRALCSKHTPTELEGTPENQPNQGAAGKKDEIWRRANKHRLVQTPAPERHELDALLNAARGRPTDPEGAEAALGRFLANWRNRKAAGPDGVFARADLWHSVANVPVELLRKAGFPWPKMAGKALLVLVPLGLACAALALAAVVAWIVLVLV